MKFLRKVRQHQVRIIKTTILYLTFLALATATSLHGPALLDLQIAARTTLDHIAYLVPSNSVGFIFGAIICGFLVESVDTQIILIVSSIINGFVIGVLPWNKTLIGMCATQALSGILTGFLEAGGNVWLIHLWGKSNPPFMQGLHFAYGVGALLAPLIVQPFQLPFVEKSETPRLPNNSMITVYTAEDVQMKEAYGFVAGMQVIIGIIFVCIYARYPENQPHPSRLVKNSDPDDVFGTDEQLKKGSKLKRISQLSILLACLFNFFYFGIELCFGYFLTTYAVKSKLKLPKSTASYMTSVFWGAYTFPRCISAIIVTFVGTQRLIVANLFLLQVANALLVFYGRQHEWALWVGVILMGAGLSPLFGAIFGFLEDFIKVTGRITSLITIACSFGSFIVPQIVGTYIDDKPDCFLWISVTCGSSMCLLFALLIFTKEWKLKETSKPLWKSNVCELVSYE